MADWSERAREFLEMAFCSDPSHCHNALCRNSGSCTQPHLLLAAFAATVEAQTRVGGDGGK